MGTRRNRRDEAVLTSTHRESMFWSKNKKNRYTRAYPSFTICKWGIRGYLFHGHVFLMQGVFVSPFRVKQASSNSACSR